MDSTTNDTGHTRSQQSMDCSGSVSSDSHYATSTPETSSQNSGSVEDSVSETSQTTEPSPRRNCEKYNLRRSSLRVQAQTEQKKQQPKEKKPKNRPPPLSKYRRRSANARERCRMQEINEAFEELKKALPQARLEAAGSEGNHKTRGQPTKINVLRLAINHISALRDILGYHNDSLCNDDLGSDAASTSTNSRTSGSGDEESLVSTDADTGVSDLEFFVPELGPDFPPDFEADLGVTLSPEEQMCLELVASVL